MPLGNVEGSHTPDQTVENIQSTAAFSGIQNPTITQTLAKTHPDETSSSIQTGLQNLQTTISSLGGRKSTIAEKKTSTILADSTIQSSRTNLITSLQDLLQDPSNLRRDAGQWKTYVEQMHQEKTTQKTEETTQENEETTQEKKTENIKENKKQVYQEETTQENEETTQEKKTENIKNNEVMRQDNKNNIENNKKITEQIKRAEQEANKIQAYNSPVFQKAETETAKALSPQLTHLTPPQQQSIIRVATFQDHPELQTDETLFRSAQDREDLLSYVSEGGEFDTLRQSMGIVTLSKSSMGMEQISAVTDTTLQPQRKAEHQKDIQKSLGKDYVKSRGSFRNVFSLYQNIIQSEERDDFAKQSQRTPQEKNFIQQATDIIGKPHAEQTPQENQRLTQNNQNSRYQKLLYQGLSKQSEEVISDTSMDTYLDTIVSGFVGGEGIQVDGQSLTYTEDQGMHINMTYHDGDPIGTIHLHDDGTMTGPQVLVPNDPIVQDSFESFVDQPITDNLIGPNHIFSIIQKNKPDRKSLIQEALKSDNPLKALKASEHKHYTTKLKNTKQKNTQTAIMDINTYISNIKAQKTNYDTALFFSTAGENTYAQNNKAQNLETALGEKVTLPARATAFAALFENSLQYYTKHSSTRDIHRLSTSFQKLQTLSINREKKPLNHRFLNEIRSKEPNTRYDALRKAFASNTKTMNGRPVLDINALEKYIHTLERGRNPDNIINNSHYKSFRLTIEEQKESNTADYDLERALNELNISQ